MTKIAILVYSVYEHILTVAKAEEKGVKEAGASVDVYQFASNEERDASFKSKLPVITPEKLAEYDGVLVGIPTRYGTVPFAFKQFFDETGPQWVKGAYAGKFVGMFVSTGTQGGGQEATIRNSLSVFVHHGMNFVPLGYALTAPLQTNTTEIHGGSPWGAGTFAGADGSRQPSKLELEIAEIQGKSFAEAVIRGLNHKSGTKATKEEAEEQRKAAAEARQSPTDVALGAAGTGIAPADAPGGADQSGTAAAAALGAGSSTAAAEGATGRDNAESAAAAAGNSADGAAGGAAGGAPTKDLVPNGYENEKGVKAQDGCCSCIIC